MDRSGANLRLVNESQYLLYREHARMRRQRTELRRAQAGRPLHIGDITLQLPGNQDPHVLQSPPPVVETRSMRPHDRDQLSLPVSIKDADILCVAAVSRGALHAYHRSAIP